MQQSIRIAFVSQFTDIVGGGEYSLLDLLRSLDARWIPLLVTAGEGRLADIARDDGIEVTHLPMPGIGPASLPALRTWLACLSRERPALVHANNSRAAFYAGIAGRWLGIPVIFHCRISDRDSRLDWLVARLATRVVANSKATAARFAPRWLEKVETIYNGIELPDESRAAGDIPEEFEGKRIVLCVARISRWKRHDLVLNAFASLANSSMDARLVMVGGPDPYEPAWMEELRTRSAALPCGDRIHWLGESHDVGRWYRAADVLVLASREEPFGRVVVEAMSYGLPVVAANAGGPAEIIAHGKSGLLVDSDASQAWADAMREVLEDDELHARLSDGGRRRAADFSLARHVGAMQDLFDRLTRGES